VLCPSHTADHGKSQRFRLVHVISCVQSQLITSVMLTVSPISAHQCQSVPPNSASQCRLSVPYISVMYQCCLSVPSVIPVNAHQCNLPVPPHQCHLSVSISAAYQCPSLQPQ
ncbi:unnamed protein product, partial [Staurois parvus]